MTTDDLLSRPSAWLDAESTDPIVVSSRIRLARNVEDTAFPGWAGETECLRLRDRLEALLAAVPRLKPALVFHMDEIADLDRSVLHERHLISAELLQKGVGSSLVVRRDERLSVMINEEDHLRLQAMRPGLYLEELWSLVDELDTEIEAHVRYAFRPDLGYLTACPTNVGTGLRASVMLHLPALRLVNEIEPLMKGLSRIGLAARGLLGEGTEATGNMVQFSNQRTLGESETHLIHRMVQIAEEIKTHELNARQRLREENPDRLRDFVSRSLGLLRHAFILPSGEAMELLSGLRLGVELDMIKGLEMETIHRLMLATQPGHFQKNEGRAYGPEERDRVRAERVRDAVRGAVCA